ncbi:hypothetical protein BDN72DRAFT_891285 [Pluteus cervinus]|uniref:Uncharacterized protein n=1 Tax=Pluteus cervinus TaxID=181527 RepID=A0ACD3BDU5_9AGAR|nr:hypothetical protein BDN72DRAFT_891285 [Pluteus cervinus]
MTSSAQNLNKGGGEAIRALLKALAPEDAAQLDKSVSAEALDRLSSKLGTILGDPSAEALQSQALNEEGLPIIEITEPEVDPTSNSSELLEDELVPLSKLPPDERERRRQEIHHLLDTLEEEEQQEEALLRQRAMERSQAALQKRREEAEAERKHLQAAKEMRKKMGKALVQNSVKGKEPEQERASGSGEGPRTEGSAQGTKVLKKTVTFADPGEDSQPDGSPPEENFGDVSMARLRAKPRATLLSQSLTDPRPVKMTVVERIPTGAKATPPTLAQDSDDESEPPESPLAYHSDGAEAPVGSGEESDSPQEPEEETDLDYAQHQREVALEYYRKRAKLGAAAADVIHANHIEDYEDLPTKDEPKPAISEFKARRLVSAFNATTPKPTSLENFTVPASSVRTLQNAIREGKLTDDNKLVGADGNSDDEDFEGAEELKELLRKGEIYNLGPDGNPILHTVPHSHSVSASDTPKPASSPLAQNVRPPPKVANPNAMSKFKASRSQGGRPSSTSSPAASSSSPALSSSVIERQAPSTRTQSQMIVESPSFQRPVNVPPAAASPNVLNPTAPPTGPFPMIIESPSFARSLGVKEYVPAPKVMSNEVRERSRPSRPPVVVAARVKESHQPPIATTVNETTSPSPNATASASDNPSANNPPKRISRFKAERT